MPFKITKGIKQNASFPTRKLAKKHRGSSSPSIKVGGSTTPGHAGPAPPATGKTGDMLRLNEPNELIRERGLSRALPVILSSFDYIPLLKEDGEDDDFADAPNTAYEFFMIQLQSCLIVKFLISSVMKPGWSGNSLFDWWDEETAPEFEESAPAGTYTSRVAIESAYTGASTSRGKQRDFVMGVFRETTIQTSEMLQAMVEGYVRLNELRHMLDLKGSSGLWGQRMASQYGAFTSSDNITVFKSRESDRWAGDSCQNYYTKAYSQLADIINSNNSESKIQDLSDLWFMLHGSFDTWFSSTNTSIWLSFSRFLFEGAYYGGMVLNPEMEEAANLGAGSSFSLPDSIAAANIMRILWDLVVASAEKYNNKINSPSGTTLPHFGFDMIWHQPDISDIVDLIDRIEPPELAVTCLNLLLTMINNKSDPGGSVNQATLADHVRRSKSGNEDAGMIIPDIGPFTGDATYATSGTPVEVGSPESKNSIIHNVIGRVESTGGGSWASDTAGLAMWSLFGTKGPYSHIAGFAFGGFTLAGSMYGYLRPAVQPGFVAGDAFDANKTPLSFETGTSLSDIDYLLGYDVFKHSILSTTESGNIFSAWAKSLHEITVAASTVYWSSTQQGCGYNMGFQWASIPITAANNFGLPEGRTAMYGEEYQLSTTSHRSNAAGILGSGEVDILHGIGSKNTFSGGSGVEFTGMDESNGWIVPLFGPFHGAMTALLDDITLLYWGNIPYGTLTHEGDVSAAEERWLTIYGNEDPSLDAVFGWDDDGDVSASSKIWWQGSSSRSFENWWTGLGDPEAEFEDDYSSHLDFSEGIEMNNEDVLEMISCFPLLVAHLGHNDIKDSETSAKLISAYAKMNVLWTKGRKYQLRYDRDWYASDYYGIEREMAKGFLQDTHTEESTASEIDALEQILGDKGMGTMFSALYQSTNQAPTPSAISQGLFMPHIGITAGLSPASDLVTQFYSAINSVAYTPPAGRPGWKFHSFHANTNLTSHVPDAWGTEGEGRYYPGVWADSSMETRTESEWDDYDGDIDYYHPFSAHDNAVADYFEYRLRKDDFYNDPLGKFIRNLFDNNLYTPRAHEGGTLDMMFLSAGGQGWKYMCPFTAGSQIQNWSAISFDRVYGSVERSTPFVVDFKGTSRFQQYVGNDAVGSFHGPGVASPEGGWWDKGASEFWERISQQDVGHDLDPPIWTEYYDEVADEKRGSPTDFTILASASDIHIATRDVTQRITRFSGIPEELISMLGTLLYTKISSIIGPDMHIQLQTEFNKSEYTSGAGQKNSVTWGYNDSDIVELYEGLIYYGKDIVGDRHFGSSASVRLENDDHAAQWYDDTWWESHGGIQIEYYDKTKKSSGSSAGNQSAYTSSGISSLFSYVINKTLEIQSTTEYLLNFFYVAGDKFHDIGSNSFDSWEVISSKFGEWNIDPHPLDGLTYENVASSLYAFHQLFKFSRSYLGDVPMNPYAGDAFNFTWFPSDTIPTCDEIDVLLAIMVDGGVIGSEYGAEDEPLFTALDSESGDPTGYSGNRANWRDDSIEIVPQNLSKRIISVGLPLGFMDYMRSVAGSCNLTGLDYRNAHIIRVRVHKIDLRYDSVVFIPQTYLFDTRLFYARENGAQGIREFYDELTWDETNIDAYATGDIEISRIISDSDTTLDTSSLGVKGQQQAWQATGGPNGKYMLTAIKLPDIINYGSHPELVAMDLAFDDFAGTGDTEKVAFIKEDLGYNNYIALDSSAKTSIFQNHMASHMLKVYQKVMCSINLDEHAHFFNNESGDIIPPLSGGGTLDHYFRHEYSPLLETPGGTILQAPATTSLFYGLLFSKLHDTDSTTGAEGPLLKMIDAMTELLWVSGLSTMEVTDPTTGAVTTVRNVEDIIRLGLMDPDSAISYLQSLGLSGKWHTMSQIVLAPIQSQLFSAYTYQHRAVEPKAFERIFSILVDVNSFKRIDPSGEVGTIIDPRDPLYEPGELGMSDTSNNEPGFFVFFTSVELLNHGGESGGHDFF